MAEIISWVVEYRHMQPWALSFEFASEEKAASHAKNLASTRPDYKVRIVKRTEEVVEVASE